MKNKIINIAIFTGTRAEYGLLRWLIRHLEEDESTEMNLIISGTHLSDRYGYTISEIQKDNIEAAALVPLSLDKNKSMFTLTAEALEGVGRALKKIDPDVMIVLGDRYEAFAAAAAAHLTNVPVAHIHGERVLTVL